MGDAEASPDVPESPRSENTSVYIGGHTVPVKLCFKCEADCTSVEVAWLDYDGNKQKYATLVPGASYAQSKGLV
jgi:hypothetical protein